MKVLAIQFICCLFLSYTLQALPFNFEELHPQTMYHEMQKDTIGEDEIEIKEKEIDAEDESESSNKEININFGRSNHRSKNSLIRVGMLDLGISSYLAEDGGLDMPDELDYMDQRLFRSVNVGIHLINLKLGFHKKHATQRFGISTGVKWNIVHYSMEKDYNLQKDSPDYESAIDYDVPALKKNRLKANYIQIPVLLEFNSKPFRSSRSLNIGVGYVHQLLLNSNYKYKTEDGTKLKSKGEYNLTKSMGMVEGRLGYGPLNFYVQYGLKDLFQKNNGPELTPINFGVNIIPR